MPRRSSPSLRSRSASGATNGAAARSARSTPDGGQHRLGQRRRRAAWPAGVHDLQRPRRIRNGGLASAVTSRRSGRPSAALAASIGSPAASGSRGRVAGQRLAELTAPASASGRVGQPLPGDRRRMLGDAHREQRAGAQQPVPRQQVGRGRLIRPGASSRAAAAAAPRRVSGGGATSSTTRAADGRAWRGSAPVAAGGRPPGGARIAQQHPVADVQRQRIGRLSRARPRRRAAGPGPTMRAEPTCERCTRPG